MNYLFVGIDVSKDTLDVAIADHTQPQINSHFVVPNTLMGIDKLFMQLTQSYSEKSFWFCFEHTGNYQLLLAHQLHNRKIYFSQIPALQIKRSLGITRGKNDKIDAQRIATYASVHRHKLKRSSPKTHNLQIISSLLSSRNLLIKSRTAFKNHLKSLLKTNECVKIECCIDVVQNQLDNLNMQIKTIENQISTHIAQDPKVKKSFDQLTSIPGVGLITAATTITYTNNFTLFANHRKFSSFCGIAPFTHQSGSSIKGMDKTSPLRNREMKKLLFAAALSSMRCDPQLSNYSQRKIAEGKHKLSVRNAVAGKIVARMFAVIRNDRHYVKLAF